MPHRLPWSLFGFVALLTLSVSPAPAEEGQTHAEAIETYRTDRVERLTSDTGWLTVTGFVWLEPGENVFGSGADALLRLPEDVAPEVAGVLDLDEETGEITVRVRSGVSLEMDKVLVREKVLKRDEGGNSPKMTLGRITFWVMERDGRAVVRMRDTGSVFRREFTGIEYFPVNAAFRVEAHVNPEDPFVELVVPNVVGYESVVPSRPVYFTLNGQDHILFPVLGSEEDSVYLFVFADETTGYESYGGGRFLYADLREDGTLDLDFNKAYNPPCAFTPYATCPLPTPENTLPVAIRAGEKRYPSGGAHE